MAAPAPTIYALSPTTIPAAGGRVVQLVARDLDATTTVTIGGTAATNVAVTSTFLLQCAAPAQAAGPAAVAVTTAGGTTTKVGAVRYV